MGVLFTPSRTRTAHIVQLGSIRIANPILQSAPSLDHRRKTGRREDDISGQLGRSENQNCGAAHDDYPIRSVCDTRLGLRSRLCDGGLQKLDGSLGRSSLTSFERNELSDQMLELAWQRLRHGRQIVDV